jgi:hypothetical protein
MAFLLPMAFLFCLLCLQSANIRCGFARLMAARRARRPSEDDVGYDDQQAQRRDVDEELREAERAAAEIALIGLDRELRGKAFKDDQAPKVLVVVWRQEFDLHASARCVDTGKLLAATTMPITPVGDFKLRTRTDNKIKAYPRYVSTLPGKVCRKVLSAYFGAAYHPEVRPCPW